MAAAASELALGVKGQLPVIVLRREVLVRVSPVSPKLLVFCWTARAIKRLGIKNGTSCDEAAFDQRDQLCGDRRLLHPCRCAGIDKEPRDHRHTAARCSPSLSAARPPSVSHLIWRARAELAAACRRAARTVSETPSVWSSRCASERRSSSRSISRFVIPASVYT